MPIGPRFLRTVAAVTAAALSARLPAAAALATKTPLNHRIKHYSPVYIHPHHVSRRAAPDYSDPRPVGEFTVEMEVAGKPLTLKMEPHNELYAPGAQVTHIAADGNTTKSALTYAGLYRGVAREHQNSFAHLHIDESQAVRGIVVLEGKRDAFHIEPSHAYPGAVDPDSGHNHVVYKESDIVYPRGGGHEESKAHPPVPMDETLFGNAHPAATEPSEAERSRRHGDAEAALVGESRSDDQVKWGPYSATNKVCAIALWADKEFTDLVGSKEAAVVRILQRWAIAQTVFDETSFAPHQVAIQIKSVTIDETATFAAEAPTAIGWLQAFSRGEEGSRDWHDVCLAHGFTNIDYSGTLGLAYTAPPEENKHQVTGGLCQQSYTNPSGLETFHNSGMSTSENFGATVGELQLSLVLAHEFGHNFGTGHDEENHEGEAGGNYLMWPISVSGAASNNNIFSPMSVAAMTGAVGYRGGCFEEEGTGTCGNFATDGGESCDCGGVDGCAALGDKCCGSDCQFKAGASCSNLDAEHGMCCDESCGIVANVECRAQDTCMARAKCSDAGLCPALSNRPEHALCETGISVCATGECSKVCDDSGSCAGSICSLWGLAETAVVPGKGSCAIYCDDGGEATAPADLGPMTVPGFASDDSTATAADVAIRVKAPGARCLFEEGDPSSGVCDKGGDCVSADTEEDLMGELLGYYNDLVNTFTDWLNKEQHGVSNIGWFCISGVLIMFSCCMCCYCENHDRARKHQDWMKVKGCISCSSASNKVAPGGGRKASAL